MSTTHLRPSTQLPPNMKKSLLVCQQRKVFGSSNHMPKKHIIKMHLQATNPKNLQQRKLKLFMMPQLHPITLIPTSQSIPSRLKSPIKNWKQTRILKNTKKMPRQRAIPVELK